MGVSKTKYVVVHAVDGGYHVAVKSIGMAQPPLLEQYVEDHAEAMRLAAEMEAELEREP